MALQISIQDWTTPFLWASGQGNMLWWKHRAGKTAYITHQETVGRRNLDPPVQGIVSVDQRVSG